MLFTSYRGVGDRRACDDISDFSMDHTHTQIAGKLCPRRKSTGCQLTHIELIGAGQRIVCCAGYFEWYHIGDVVLPIARTRWIYSPIGIIRKSGELLLFEDILSLEIICQRKKD